MRLEVEQHLFMFIHLKYNAFCKLSFGQVPIVLFIVSELSFCVMVDWLTTED